jgi:hypothetical protein
LKPDDVSLVGFTVLLIGLILFFGQVYGCGSGGGGCPTDATVKFAGYLIPLGGFVTVAGSVVMEVLRKPI